MKRCKNCGGIINADVTEIDDDSFCTCGNLSFNEKLQRDYEWKKQQNKKYAEHWKNGRDKHND